MSVSQPQFVAWLGQVMAANKSCVENVRKLGRNAPDTLYVGRARKNEPASAGRFGNPFYETSVGRFGAIQKYVAYLLGKPEHERLMLLLEVRTALDEGKFLLCWCSSPEAPLACHAHVLAGWARSLDITETRLKIEDRAAPVCTEDYDPEPEDEELRVVGAEANREGERTPQFAQNRT